MDTGGRFTEATNDLGLAYSRAQRDLGCTYTLGFYVDGDVDARRICHHNIENDTAAQQDIPKKPYVTAPCLVITAESAARHGTQAP